MNLLESRPCLKKGNVTDSINYCPLSILPTFTKIYERVMYIRLFEFLETIKLFDNEQHTFRGGKSVITAGIYFVNSIVDAVVKVTMLLFMDLIKAFNSVSHSSRINYLKEIGKTGVAL